MGFWFRQTNGTLPLSAPLGEREIEAGVFAPPPRTAPQTEEVQHSAQSGTTTPATMSSGTPQECEASENECHQPIGLPGVPFTFSLSESPWTPERSWLYPASFKQTVATGLLCRPKEGMVGLPAEIWIKHIIPWCSRRWFECPRNGTPAMQPAATPSEAPSSLVLPVQCGKAIKLDSAVGVWIVLRHKRHGC
eukprot:s1141_g9.t1